MNIHAAMMTQNELTDLVENDPRYLPHSHMLNHGKTVYHIQKGEFEEARKCCSVGSARARRRQTLWVGLDQTLNRIDVYTIGNAEAARKLALEWGRSQFPNMIFGALHTGRIFRIPEILEPAREALEQLLASPDSSQRQRTYAR